MTDYRAQFAWEHTPAENITYNIYLVELNKYAPYHFASTPNLSYTFLPTWEGTWLFGVAPVINSTEGYICWSDDIDCVINNQPFQIKVQYHKKQGMRWRIMWK